MKYILINIFIIIFSIALKAQKFDYYFDKGQVNLDTGNYKLATFYYDSALRKNPKHANSYYNRGLAKSLLEEYYQDDEGDLN
jgi:tetratricopeptide (TPR) repeat protein